MRIEGLINEKTGVRNGDEWKKVHKLDHQSLRKKIVIQKLLEEDNSLVLTERSGRHELQSFRNSVRRIAG